MEDLMKRAALALFLACLLVTPPAGAAEKPAAEPVAPAAAAEAPVSSLAPSFETKATDPAVVSKIEEIAKAHKRYADDFGFKKFAAGNVAADGNSYTLKYLAEGDSMTSWTTMMAMTVYILPLDTAAARGYMAKTIAMLERDYKKYAAIITDQKFTDTKDDPMLFFEYMMGKGDQQVYTSADFMRTGKDTAAFIQYSSRGKPVSTEMSVKMKEVVFLEAK
jgi:hypothetical protein